MMTNLSAQAWIGFPTLVLALGPALAGCNGDVTGPAARDQVAEAIFSFQVDAANVGALLVESVNGTISITGAPGADSVTVQGVRRVRSTSREDAERHLDDVRVAVETAGSTIVATTIQPQEPGDRDYVVDYEITVPAELAVAVDGSNGSVTLVEIAGDALVDFVNGDIECEMSVPLAGTVDLETVNGDIELRIPTNTSAALTAIVGVGLITTTGLELHDAQSTATSLTARLGAGQAEISLSAGTGDIAVVGF